MKELEQIREEIELLGSMIRAERVTPTDSNRSCTDKQLDRCWDGIEALSKLQGETQLSVDRIMEIHERWIQFEIGVRNMEEYDFGGFRSRLLAAQGEVPEVKPTDEEIERLAKHENPEEALIHGACFTHIYQRKGFAEGMRYYRDHIHQPKTPE